MQDELDTCTGGAFPGILQMKYFPFWAILALHVGIVAIPHDAHADEHDKNPLTIVVTSSRAAETVDETMAPVTIIDREEIDRSGVKSVDELLTRVPGLIVTHNGGRGAASSIFLRGTSSRHVLILIDGVKIGSATLGTASLNHLPLSVVEKIEVVRGPRSSLYGSEAIGGVIQVFTRRAKQAFSGNLTVSAGSHDTYEVDAGFSDSNSRNWYSVNMSSLDTEGFNVCNGKSSSCRVRNLNFPDNYEPADLDKDGYRNRSLNFSAGGHLTERIDLTGGLTLSDNDTEFDGSQNESDKRIRTLFLQGDWFINGGLKTSLTLSESLDEVETFNKGEFFSRFKTIREQASWISQWNLENHRMISGIDFIQDQIESSNNYSVRERDNTGYFASLRSSFKTLDMELSVRLDDNEQYGEKTTGSAALGRDLPLGWRLTGSYGTAFKAPTFNDLYWPGSESPDLIPEESSSTEIGIIYSRQSTRVSFHAYRTKIENLIAWAPTSGGPWKPGNVDKAKISGLEIEFQTTINTVNLNGSFTLQEPLNDSGINRNRQLRRRAKQLAFLDISQNFNPWKLGLSLHYRGKSYDDAANTNLVNGFGRVDTRLARLFQQDWNLELKINNLFDKDYETVRGYHQDGRNFLITLRYSPQ